ncbi:hypothetical protein [Ensifer aridi]|uniref:hypothetical protein n=1 Tax=Ensifer aridi TaxID=1708715 RepID=UPI003B8A8058
MPARVEPRLAVLVDVPPRGPGCVYEVKRDGYRLAVHIELGRVRMITAATIGRADFLRSSTTRDGSP